MARRYSDLTKSNFWKLDSHFSLDSSRQRVGGSRSATERNTSISVASWAKAQPPCCFRSGRGKRSSIDNGQPSKISAREAWVGGTPESSLTQLGAISIQINEVMSNIPFPSVTVSKYEPAGKGPTVGCNSLPAWPGLSGLSKKSPGLLASVSLLKTTGWSLLASPGHPSGTLEITSRSVKAGLAAVPTFWADHCT
jgi:hypothetical protein